MGDRFDKVVEKAYFIVDTLEGKCTCEECETHNPPEPKTNELVTTSYNEYVYHKVQPETLDELEDAVFRLKAAGAVGDERVRMEYDGSFGIKVKNADLVLNGVKPKMIRLDKHNEIMVIKNGFIGLMTALFLFALIMGIVVW